MNFGRPARTVVTVEDLSLIHISTNFKTVCVDIRFVLWIMDKYAGAGKLIDEMRLVK